MDQDTYEQLMRVQISLDELKEKVEYLIDEIDELKRNEEQKKSCGNTPAEEEQKNTQQMQKRSVKIPGWQSSGSK